MAPKKKTAKAAARRAIPGTKGKGFTVPSLGPRKGPKPGKSGGSGKG